MKRTCLVLLLIFGCSSRGFGDGESTKFVSPPGDIIRALPAPKNGIQPSVRLLMLDPENLFPHPLDPISEELTSIFESIGVDIRFRRESNSVAAVMPEELVVVLTNHQNSGWLSRHRIRDRIMGAVMNSKGSKHTMFIYIENIVRLLNLRWVTVQEDSSSRIAELGKALGRVIGHELIHAVVPDHSHTSSGLMRSRLTRDDLVYGDMRLDEVCTAAFLSALADKGKNRNVAEDQNARPPVPTAAGDGEGID